MLSRPDEYLDTLQGYAGVQPWQYDGLPSGSMRGTSKGWQLALTVIPSCTPFRGRIQAARP